MVADRGRSTALWFVALLVSATFVGMIPTAAAAPSTVDNVSLKFEDGSAIARTVKSGDVLRLFYNVSVPPCATVGGVSTYPSTNVSANTGGRLTASNNALTFTPTTATTMGNLQIVVGSGITDLDASAPLRLTLAPAACTGGLQHDADTEDTQSIVVDNKGPTISFTESWQPSANKVFQTSTIRGIGDTVTFTPTATDLSTVASNSMTRASAAVDGTASAPVTPGNLVSITVAAASGSIPAVNGATGTYITVSAADALGNIGTKTLTFALDNQAPTVVSAPSTLTRSAAGSILDHRLSGISADATFYALYQKNASDAPAIVRLEATAANPSDHAFTLADNLNTPVQFSIRAIDSAGNMQTTAHTVAIPQANFSYGREGDNPSTVVCTGTGHVCVGNMYVTVGTDGPLAADLYAVGQNAEPLLYGELTRSDGTRKFWKQGTSGVFSATDTTSWVESSARDLQPFNDAAGTPTATVFQPGPTVTGLLNNVVLTNLSHGTGRTRTLGDGFYFLNFTVTNPDATEGAHKLIVSRTFRVDSTSPAAPLVSSYSGAIWSPPDHLGTNMSGLHGRDGNPVQVFVSATDNRTVHAVAGPTNAASASRLDSGIRNITVELVDAVTNQVAKRTLTGQEARLNFTIADIEGMDELDHFYDFRGLSPQSTTVCAHPHPIPEPLQCTIGEWSEQNYSMSWYNETQFSGWVNITYPDLEAGQYYVRTLVWDNAGRNTTKMYMTNEKYVVAPNVKIVASADSPRVTEDGRLAIEVMASQRYVDVPQEIASQCSDGFCGVQETIVWLTNDPGSGNRIEYERFFRARNTVVDDDDFPGFDSTRADGYLESPLINHPRDTNGTLAYLPDAHRIRHLIYTTTQELDVISGVSLNNLYVQVEAVSAKPDGTGVVSRTTDWVRVATQDEGSLVINAPATDWQLNVTSLGANHPTGNHAKPPFNVTFDRKVDPNAPHMRYWINTTAGVVVDTWEGLVPLNSGSVAPRFKFNWTGSLNKSDGSTLDAGAYSFDVQIYEGTATLANARRYFIMQAEEPEVVVPAGQTNFGLISKPNGDRIVARQFELKFSVEHGFVNLTSLNDLKFTLSRETGSGGSSTLVAGDNTEGFVVRLRPESPLEQNALVTSFTANITLPGGDQIPNNATFTLNITAELDVEPKRLGDFSTYVELVYDRVAPNGALLVPESLATMTDATSSNPRVKTDPFRPAFVGFARDAAAGVKDVEVRIVDLTDNVSIVWDDDGSADRVDGLDRATWATSVKPTPTKPGLITLEPLNQGNFKWSLALVDRPGGYPNIWEDDEEGSRSKYVFNLSHEYRVEMRFRDSLSQLSDVVTTTFVFDGYGPELAYGTRLGGVSSGLPSGIHTDAMLVDWHAEEDGATMTVKVTDNHCIAEVRLWSQAEGSATTNSWPMKPVGVSGRRVCPDDGAIVTYRLELEDAPNLTDTVGNVRFWFSATDHAGNTTVVPEDFRTLVITVVDTTPAAVRPGGLTIDPPVGQSGGRSLIRADVFDNVAVEKVTIAIYDVNNTATPLASGDMRILNATNGVGIWEVDTTADLGLELETGDYRVVVTPYDVNWNRSEDLGGPTCEDFECPRASLPYAVRDDGIPTVGLELPVSNNATVNATPTIKLRALHKAIDTSGITIRVTTDGNESNLTAVDAANLTFVELNSTAGARQGYSVEYKPTAPLPDNSTLIVNISMSVGGLTSASTYTFRVDAVGPTVEANVTGTRVVGDRTYATSATRITIAANDSVSATTILYKVGTGAAQTYTGPLTPSGPDGDWTLEYWAVDSAGNTGEKKTLSYVLDTVGPRITVAQHGDEILLTVIENGSGLNESSVTVYYRYGDSPSYSQKVADKVTSNSFSVVLPGNASENGLRYYFTAEDLLGNLGTEYSATAPYVIGVDNETASNLPPTVRITSPTAGASVGSTFDLKWLAEDPEGAPLSISIALRDPAPGRVLSAGGSNSGTFPVNLTGLPAGAYTIVVTATDGENSVSAQVAFTIEGNDIIRAPTLPPATVQPNTPVTFSVTIEPTGKTVAQASYRVIRDGQLAGQGQLTPTQGVYAAGFTPTQPGRYAIIVDVRYTDGTSEAPKQIGGFTVPGTTTPPEEDARGTFPVSLMSLAAIALVTIALAAYGAFGRWKK